MTPFLRVATLTAAGVMLVLAGAGVAYYLARWPAEGDPTRSRVAATPPVPASLPGDRMLPDAAGAYDRAEQQHREAVEQATGPGAAIPPIDTLNPTETIPLPAGQPGEVAATRRQREPERRAVQAQERAVKDKAQGMTKVLAAWGGVHTTVDARLKPPEPERREATAASPEGLANLPVDRLYYGLLRVYLSSDEPGPVVVSLQDGVWQGARLIGNFQRAAEKVVIHFDRMTFQGAWYAVDAYALDPDSGRVGLATAVERRTFSRWAALLGSAMLQGAQRAYLRQGTQTNYLWGSSTTHDFNDREILGIAVGEIGARTRQAATEYFNRPPTVYVDPARQLVGVLFMGPPHRQNDGPLLAAVPNPSHRLPLATVPNDGLAATAASLDPSANDARESLPLPTAPLSPAPADE